MAKVLIATDNEILAEMYSLNLEVYTGTEAIVVKNVEEAMAILNKKIQIDVLVTHHFLQEVEAAKEFKNYFDTSKLKTQLIIVGPMKNPLAGVLHIPLAYNIQMLLRSVAQIVGVTAKDMAEMKVPNFYPIPLKLCSNIEKTECNIYIRVTKNAEEFDYILASKKGAALSGVVKKFIESDMDFLYVVSSDRLVIVNQISRVMTTRLVKADTPVAEKVAIASQGFDLVANAFSTNEEVTQEVINLSNACVKSMDLVVKEQPNLKGLLSLLTENKQGYLYSHSILASYVATHIVKNVSWGGEGHIEKVNFVLFFHDIFLVPIYSKYPECKYEEDLLFYEKLSETDKDIVMNHARMASESMAKYKRMPMGADVMMKQHHGMTNGSGFAMDFKDDISPLAKVIIISEAFVEEFMRNKDKNPDYVMNMDQMIKFLYDKFKKNSYKKIIDILETIRI